MLCDIVAVAKLCVRRGRFADDGRGGNHSKKSIGFPFSENPNTGVAHFLLHHSNQRNLLPRKMVAVIAVVAQANLFGAGLNIMVGYRFAFVLKVCFLFVFLLWQALMTLPRGS